MPAITKEALGKLVKSVEVSHFGGVQSDESDYLSCRESFECIATARVSEDV